MPLFDTYVMVDWSASNEKRSSKKPKKDAIWWAVHPLRPDADRWFKDLGTEKLRHGHVCVFDWDEGAQVYERTREEAIGNIERFLQHEAERDHRVLVGFDFAFGYPSGFARKITGKPFAKSMWQWLCDQGLTASSKDSERSSGIDRYHVAKILNKTIEEASCGEDGPFWDVHGKVRSIKANEPHDPYGKSKGKEWPDALKFKQDRVTDKMASGTQPLWKLSGAGAVGSQALLGMPWLLHLRKRLGEMSSLSGGRCVVWPFDGGFDLTPTDDVSRVVIVEIYPSLLRDAVNIHINREDDEIVDCAQVRLNALAFSLLDQKDGLHGLFRGPENVAGTRLSEECRQRIAHEEGWIFGVDEKEYHKYQLLCTLKQHFRMQDEEAGRKALGVK